MILRSPLFSTHILSNIELSRANPYFCKFISCGQSDQPVLTVEYFHVAAP